MSNSKTVIERHVAAWNAHDAAADPWSADAEMVAPGARLAGREAVLEFERGFWDAFPDARLDLVVTVADGSRAAAEGRLTGTHRGVFRTPAGEIPASGRSVTLRWMAMYEVRGDRLASEHLYFDPAELIGQLSGTPN